MLLLDDLITSNSENAEDCISLCRFLRSRLLYQGQEKRGVVAGNVDTNGNGGDSPSSRNTYSGDNQHERVVCHPIYQILDRCFQKEDNLKSIDSELYETIKYQLSQIIDGNLVIVESTVASTNFSPLRSSVRTEKDLLSQVYQEIKKNEKEELMFRTKAQILYGQYQRSRSRRKLVFKIHSQLSSPFKVNLDLLSTPKDLYTTIDEKLVKGYRNCDALNKKKFKIYRQEGSTRKEILFNSNTSDSIDDNRSSCNEKRNDEDGDLLIDFGFKYPGANLYIELDT